MLFTHNFLLGGFLGVNKNFITEKGKQKHKQRTEVDLPLHTALIMEDTRYER